MLIKKSVEGNGSCYSKYKVPSCYYPDLFGLPAVEKKPMPFHDV